MGNTIVYDFSVARYHEILFLEVLSNGNMVIVIILLV